METLAGLEHELTSECRSQVQSDGPSTVTPESSQMSQVFAKIWRGFFLNEHNYICSISI